jgi:hypothetical protein
MKLADLQREAEQLSPDEQRKLIGFLVGISMRRDESYRAMITSRLDDKNPENWISLQDAKRMLSEDGV